MIKDFGAGYSAPFKNISDMATLPTEEIYFSDSIKFLGQLEPFKSNGLQTDTIFIKTLPAFGATFWEIMFPRNSIMIEPHQPVIMGKQIKHPNILGVYSDIPNKKIKEYLENDIVPKKIMTTPEGYKRVKDVIIKMRSKFSLYEDFFLLYDECDRLITDNDYRSKIALPMQDFFKFKNKALISATAIIPHDPRFRTNNFKVVKLIPDYSYKKNIDLILTNNIVNTLRTKLENLNSKNPIFIFLNSTLTIHSIIDILGIQDRTKVFCSEDSRILLQQLGIVNTASTLGDYDDINFITSRFFSAVDIDLDYKPDLIMISDLISAKHSMLDPSTEVIQITGRFRKQENSNNNQTANSITHITNLKANIKYWGAKQAKHYLNTMFKSYELKSNELKSSANMQLDEVEMHALKEELNKLPFNEYIKLDGEIDYFLVDNYLHKQRVKSYYVDQSSIENAYKSSNYFVVNTTIDNGSLISDDDNIKLSIAKTKIKQTELVAERLLKLTAPTNHTTFNFGNKEKELKFLHEKFPDATSAFFTIGYDAMKERKFMLHKMRKEVLKTNMLKSKIDSCVIEEVFESFQIGKFYSNEEYKMILATIFSKFQIEEIIFPRHLKLYFEVSRTGKKLNKKGYEIISRKLIADIQNM